MKKFSTDIEVEDFQFNYFQDFAERHKISYDEATEFLVNFAIAHAPGYEKGKRAKDKLRREAMGQAERMK